MRSSFMRFTIPPGLAPAPFDVYNLDIEPAMPKRTPLGEFETLVLLAILRHAGGVVGSHIGRELEARAKRRVSRGIGN